MTSNTATLYRDLLLEVKGITSGVSDPITNAANVAALLAHGRDGICWAGFYFLKNGELVLGPFQGKAAAGRLRLGHGVSGRAAVSGKTERAADGARIAVPLIHGGAILGVLVLDGLAPGAFDDADAAGLEAVAQVFVAASY
jgi:L-methionine (R)-S-oxide reductase